MKGCLPVLWRRQESNASASTAASSSSSATASSVASKSVVPPLKQKGVDLDDLSKTDILQPGTLVLFFGRDRGHAGCRGRKVAAAACKQVGVVVDVDGVKMIAEGNSEDGIRFFPATMILGWRMAHDMALDAVYLRSPKFATAEQQASLRLHLRALAVEHKGRPGAASPSMSSTPADPAESAFFALPEPSNVDTSFLTVVFQASGLLSQPSVSVPVPLVAWAQPWSTLRKTGSWKSGFKIFPCVRVETPDDWALEWDGDGIAAAKAYRRASVVSAISMDAFAIPSSNSRTSSAHTDSDTDSDSVSDSDSDYSDGDVDPDTEAPPTSAPTPTTETQSSSLDDVELEV